MEDVLVKVQDLIIHAAFYVRNMGDSVVKKPLMLLGRPFLKTAKTLINCETEKLTCKFAGEMVTFDIYKAEQYPPDVESVEFVESMQRLIGMAMGSVEFVESMQQLIGMVMGRIWTRSWLVQIQIRKIHSSSCSGPDPSIPKNQNSSPNPLDPWVLGSRSGSVIFFLENHL